MTLLQVVGEKPINFLITLDPAKLNGFYNDLVSDDRINQLSTLGRLIGGFGALFYISFRVWKHMANNEPINIFPLLRPFFIGFCLMIFPSIIKVMNALLHPMITVTEAMVNYEQTTTYSCDTGTYWTGWPRDWMCLIFRYPISQLFLIIGMAVALGLNVLRLFYLVLLAILGPIAFALSIFDGFEGNMAGWIKKYVTIYMWLPVLNILQMVINKVLLNLITGQDSFFTALIFLLISVYTYTKVPAVTSWIVEAGGGAGGGGFEQAGGAAAAGFVGGLATRVGPVAGAKAIGGLAAAKMGGGAGAAMGAAQKK